MPSITVQPELLLERILSLEIVRVTERAAVSSARLRGHGKDKASDQAAVDAMRQVTSPLIVGRVKSACNCGLPTLRLPDAPDCKTLKFF